MTEVHNHGTEEGLGLACPERLIGACELDRIKGEIEHWKAHAKEAGDGFTAVSKTAARLAARNVELVETLDRVEALMNEWQAEADKVRGISMERWAQMYYFPSRLRDVLATQPIRDGGGTDA